MECFDHVFRLSRCGDVSHAWPNILERITMASLNNPLIIQALAWREFEQAQLPDARVVKVHDNLFCRDVSSTPFSLLRVH